MIQKYFRCGDPSQKCPNSVTKEIIKVTAKDGIDCSCPCENPNCADFREAVSLVEGFTGGKSWIVYGGGAALALIILLLLLLAGKDPCVPKLQDFQARLTTIDKDLVALANTPNSDKSSEGQIKRDVASLESDTNKFGTLVSTAEASHDEDSISDLLAEIKQRIESAEKMLQTMDKPEPGSGVKAAKAKALIGKLITLQQEVEEQCELAETECQKHVGEFENLRSSGAAILSKARRIVSPDTSAGQPDASLKATVEKCITDLQSLQRRLESIPPPPDLAEEPFPRSEASLLVAAAPGLAKSLVGPLAAAWTESTAVTGPEGAIYIDGGAGKKIIVDSRDSAKGFERLATEDVALYIADRAPTTSELARFGSNFKESRSVAEVIALDAMTLLVHPENPINTYEVGQALSLRASAGPQGSAVRNKAEQFGLRSSAIFEAIGEEAAMQDRNVLACGLYHLEGQNLRAKRLAVKASKESSALKPSPFTIATEEYLYSYRIVAWTHTKPSEHALSFVKFITSNMGQATVKQAGFVDLRLVDDAGKVDPEKLAALGEAIGSKTISDARRLSTNIRFGVNDAQLDLKAQADLERITRTAASDYPKHTVVILGFTDSSGGPSINQPLSVKRAESVADELRRSKVETRSNGLGALFPIDSNETEAGKSRNRRAEVWVVKP